MSQLKEVPRPTLPCDDCMEKEAAEFVPAGGNLLFVYCKHNAVGGTYISNGCGGGMWNIYTPINESEYANLASASAATFLLDTKKHSAEAKLLNSSH